MDTYHRIAYFDPTKKNLPFQKIGSLSTVNLGISPLFRFWGMEKIQTLHHHQKHINMECR